MPRLFDERGANNIAANVCLISPSHLLSFIECQNSLCFETSMMPSVKTVPTKILLLLISSFSTFLLSRSICATFLITFSTSLTPSLCWEVSSSSKISGNLFTGARKTCELVNRPHTVPHVTLLVSKGKFTSGLDFF